jgi:hypothetical protein
LSLFALLAACADGAIGATTTTGAPPGESTTAAGAETTVNTSLSEESTASTTNANGYDDLVAAAENAADAFLAALDDAQLAGVVFDYDDYAEKASAWSNFPSGLFSDRQGAKLGDLSDQQRALAMAVLDAVLSDQGMEQVYGILAADDYLGSSGGGGGRGPGGGSLEYSSDNYYLAFYGDPSTDSAWTIQFGGHHLAFHISLGDGTVSVSPLFTGVEPTTFTGLDGVEYSPMVEEASAVFGFLASLDTDQRATVELSGTYNGLIMGPGIDTGYPSVGGVSYTELSAEQQAMVLQIIRLWVEDADEALSSTLMDKYVAELDQTYVGWSGSTDILSESSYFIVYGPSLWLEYSNEPGVQTSEVHYHTLYRDQQVDYGTGTT